MHVARTSAGEGTEQDIHQDGEDCRGDNISLLDPAVAVELCSSTEGIIHHEGGVPVELCHQSYIQWIEAGEAHCLPEDILVSRVKGVAPVNPEAVQLLFLTFRILNNGDQFVSLTWTATLGSEALLLFFQDIISLQELVHTVVDDG